ncbi:hypothetical protein ACHHYP_00505 [Achlya hypogyna]|uniref:Uncharacterized protein n=1 Tax=Achlya hypogyna TaxID=1202772 RepID=A0A1V9ZAM6_ACHHY|nr:hypothetical protein ACHHYP_00505 [Achlya hypogyna]
MSGILLRTTYCYASPGPASATPLSPAALGVLGVGNGGVCPATIASTLPPAVLRAEPVNITWTVALNDQAYVETLAIVNGSTVVGSPPVQIVQSALYFCPGVPSPACSPYAPTATLLPALPTASPLNFTRGAATFDLTDARFDVAPGTYTVFVLATVPGLRLPNTTCRVDLVSYATLEIRSPPAASGLSAAQWAYIGVGVAGVVVVVLVVVLCYCRRQKREHAARVMTAFAAAHVREQSSRRPSQRAPSSRVPSAARWNREGSDTKAL